MVLLSNWAGTLIGEKQRDTGLIWANEIIGWSRTWMSWVKESVSMPYNSLALLKATCTIHSTQLVPQGFHTFYLFFESDNLKLFKMRELGGANISVSSLPVAQHYFPLKALLSERVPSILSKITEKIFGIH